MDLSEGDPNLETRHPWETARVAAVGALLRRLRLQAPRVLDVGCGDGYLVRTLKDESGFGEVFAQDIAFTAELMEQLQTPGVRFLRELGEEHLEVDLLLLLDVLEHVDDPVAFLQGLVGSQLAARGNVLITVPAFQRLFTAHDEALSHRRRYSRSEIASVARSAGLEVFDSGYLFFSLLLPRALAALHERVVERSAANHGIGSWKGPPSLTRWVHRTLVLDNTLCLKAQARGLRVPGLTAWLLCKKPSS